MTQSKYPSVLYQIANDRVSRSHLDRRERDESVAVTDALVCLPTTQWALSPPRKDRPDRANLHGSSSIYLSQIDLVISASRSQPTAVIQTIQSYPHP